MSKHRDRYTCRPGQCVDCDRWRHRDRYGEDPLWWAELQWALRGEHPAQHPEGMTEAEF